MVSEDDLFALCRKTCFAASALGYIALVAEKDSKTQYAFQSAIGNLIEGEFNQDKKQALYTTCVKFNEQVQYNGKQ